jgi:hypothetical protein
MKPGLDRLAEYADELARSGVPIVGLTDDDFWMGYESWALMRMPAFSAGEPDRQRLDTILRSTRAIVATYLLDPDADHPANAWLYVCRDPEYSIEKLAPAMRRNVRRGLRELRIAPAAPEDVLADGFQAFTDTRARVGVSDGTHENFIKWFTPKGRYQSHTFLGAWHGRDLVAYLSITSVEDWVEIEGCYSANAALDLRPNDTLMATALNDCLVNRRSRLVSYGLSSIQSESNAEGLHRFKTKVGFDAMPMHRAFVVHPLVRPFVNDLAYRCVHGLLTLRPANRVLKKCDGVLAAVLGRKTLGDA